MNFEQARTNMIEQQIRTWEVLDPRVLGLIAEVPRERFVPAGFLRLAFADAEIPLGHGEVMMTPRMEARLVQSVAPTPGDRVLEVGTGSGYLTALLARASAHVTSLDIIGEFTARARTLLAVEGVANATLAEGDGLAGHAAGAPWDVIVLTGSVHRIHADLPGQLAPGGRLFAVVGRAPVMEAVLVTRTGESAWTTDSLFETVLPPLRGVPVTDGFVL